MKKITIECYGSFRYGIWRVLTGLHNSVEFKCMEAGHTKFHPDWFVEGTCNNMNIYFLKCAIHRAICMIQHLQSFGNLTLIHASI